MPLPSDIKHPATQPAVRQRPKSPNRVLSEAEAQWLFTEQELANTPSIQDGMPAAEEKELRAKGVNFIVQVGIMLKLPQLTLSTAAIFFQRFLMRASLKRERNGIPKLHHYQTAATALFLATKVEESCRKMREIILACCRVAQKNPSLNIDEQSKDFWRWRDCILHNEDVLLEVLCFDLTVESPHRQLFELLKLYRVEHNKQLRNAAWAFVTDSSNTQLCLLHSSRTIACASLYAACRFCTVALPDDAKARPWWETQHVRLKDVKRAVDYMCANFEQNTNKVNGMASGQAAGSEGNASIYIGLSTPAGANGAAAADDAWDPTRMRRDRQDQVPSTSPYQPPADSESRRASNSSSVSGTKRSRDEAQDRSERNGDAGSSNDVDDQRDRAKRLKTLDGRSEAKAQNGILESAGIDPGGTGGLKREEEAMKVDQDNRESRLDAQAAAKAAVKGPPEQGEVSEEGEVEE